MRVEQSVHQFRAWSLALVRNIRPGRRPLIKNLALLLAFVLATSVAVGAPASGADAAAEAAQPKKFCVDNFKTKKVTCAATLEMAEALNGVSSENARGTGVAPDSAQADYISFVLWNNYNYTGSGYFLWNYPCYPSGTSWNNLIDWQDQTRSAQPIQCGDITLYSSFNLYTHPNGPTYCYSLGGNVTINYPNGYGRSFMMGNNQSVPPGC